MKLWFSPMIIFGMPYKSMAPLHMEQGVARQLSWPVRVNYLGRLTLGNLLS
ncbi:hypothetical protein [Eoetvoesiella caeni]